VRANGRGKPLVLKPSRASGGEGAIRVARRLSDAAVASLKRRNVLTFRVKVTFTPTGG